MSAAFRGLPVGLTRFLGELAANNERQWFVDHKAEYEALVRDPLRALVAALAETVLKIDPAFDVDPRGGAVSRIYRDTRFSRDKSPYRINQWICFKRPGQGWQERPAFFLEIGPAGWRHGMGCYAAPPAVTKTQRAAILARPGRFLAAMNAALAAGFGVEGEAYVRPKLPEGLDPVLAQWISRKSPYVACTRPVEPLLSSPELVEELRQRWQALEALYRLLA
ncbi:MAG: DUF2461 domain-containing protein [Magnetospirillum sp.]